MVLLTSLSVKDARDTGGPATSGTGTVTITGQPQVWTDCNVGHCQTVYDSGDVSITVNGFQAYTSYGRYDDAGLIASRLTDALNATSSPVRATVVPHPTLSGSYLITLTAKESGLATNYTLSTHRHFLTSFFNVPSYTATPSGSTLTGGTDATPAGPPRYSFSLDFAPNGNVTSSNDSVNGNWAYGYDDFNRLTTASKPGMAFTYDYDRFGNRWHQNGPYISSLGFDANNRIASGSTVAYDAAGNVINDGTHTYTYDAENRIVAVDGGSIATYVYNAAGERVRKTSASGTVDYLYDLAGHVISEVNAAGVWTREEIYAAGRHLATYSGGATGTTYFAHADSVGTERLRTNVAGTSYEACTSLPFGDWMQCTGSDPSPLHFNAKEHDAESGLDNFGARYYASLHGRWLTPDWSARQEAVPYASLENPQTLNLYAYVGNNPVTRADLDGHASRTITQNGETYAGPYHPLAGGYGAPENRDQEQEQKSLLQNQKPPSQMSTGEFLKEGVKGVYDTTAAPLVQAVEHPIQTIKNTASDLVEGVTRVATDPKGTLVTAAGALKDQAVEFGHEVAAGNPRAIGQAAGLVIDAFIATRAAQGREIKLGDNLRIAPTGNRTGHPVGRFPHYHRRIVGPDGKTVPGGSMKWHRPWEP